MTSKPAKSEVARSLEKIALEKGLIKPEQPNPYKTVAEAHKTATAFTPSDNLAENIFKLCNGLRAKGFDKYASELEVKFIQYKKADAMTNALYDISPETSQQLLDHAHPEGSHTMKDVEGDAIVEDLVEKQKKIQQAILKEPTGKLAAKDAVNIAKIILAQQLQQDPIQQQMAQIKKYVDNAKKNTENAIDGMIAVGSEQSHFDPNVGDLFSHPWETIKQHKSLLLGYLGLPGIITAAALQFFQKYKTTLQDLKTKLQADYDDYSTSSSSENLKALTGRIQEVKKVVQGMPADVPEMQKHWLDILDGALQDMSNAETAHHNLSPGTQTPVQTQTTAPVADPATQKAWALMDKIDASSKAHKMTVAQHDQFAEALIRAIQGLKDPQKADQARKAIDQMEQWLASKQMV